MPQRAVVDRPYRKSVRERFTNCMAELEPIDSRPEGASPFGLLHMLGNAREWTESLCYEAGRDGPDWDTHLLRGGCYESQPGGWSLVSFFQGPPDDWDAIQTNGFRCAKSATP